MPTAEIKKFSHQELIRQAAPLFLVISGFLPAASFAQVQTPTPNENGFFDRDMKSGSLVEGMDFGQRRKLGAHSGSPSLNNRPDTEKGKAPTALVPEIEQPALLGNYIPTPRPTPTPEPEEPALLPAEEPIPTTAPEIPDTSEVPRGAEFYQRLIDQVRQPLPSAPPEVPQQDFPVKPPKQEKRYTF